MGRFSVAHAQDIERHLTENRHDEHAHVFPIRVQIHVDRIAVFVCVLAFACALASTTVAVLGAIWHEWSIVALFAALSILIGLYGLLQLKILRYGRGFFVFHASHFEYDVAGTSDAVPASAVTNITLQQPRDDIFRGQVLTIRTETMAFRIRSSQVRFPLESLCKMLREAYLKEAQND